MKISLKETLSCNCDKYACKHYWIEYNKQRPGHSTVGMHRKRFGGLREFIIQRDSRKCIQCGMTRQQHKDIFGKDLTVNHIDHQSSCSVNFKGYINNDPGNLETLCLRCHGSKDAIKHGKYAIYYNNL